MMKRVAIKGGGTALARRASRQGCIWAARSKSIGFGQAQSAQNAMRLGFQAVVKSLFDTLAFIENTPVRA